MWVVWIGTLDKPKAHQHKPLATEVEADDLIFKLSKIFSDLVVTKEYVV